MSTGSSRHRRSWRARRDNSKASPREAEVGRWRTSIWVADFRPGTVPISQLMRRRSVIREGIADLLGVQTAAGWLVVVSRCKRCVRLEPCGVKPRLRVILDQIAIAVLSVANSQ